MKTDFRSHGILGVNILWVIQICSVHQCVRSLDINNSQRSSRWDKRPVRPIHISGLFPLTPGVSGAGGFCNVSGAGILPSALLAVEHVNDRQILKGYRLELLAEDSQCDMAVGTKLFFDMMHDQPSKVMLFGDACTHVTAPIAQSAKFWNISQLSYADTNPTLSNRDTYPTFFRTVPSDSEYNPARISFLRYFNWTRVGTLFQDASRGSPRYSHAHNELVELLEEEKIETVTDSFSSDPQPALTNLKQKDVRIIIGNFDEEMARKVFCSALTEKMFGPKYVWLVLGDYSDDWWQVNDTSITCTPRDLAEVLEGYFGSDVLPLSRSKRRTISNLTADEYRRRYDERRGEHYSKFHGYAYDGIWVVAMAIDNILKQNGGEYDASEFRGEKIQVALNDTNFMGVTGKVTFKEGDRIGSVVFKQFQGGVMRTVAEFSAHTNELEFIPQSQITWLGSRHPRDRTVIEKHLHRVNLTIYLILCTFSALGIQLALCFLTINIRYRKHRYIKMSSPNMNNMIIAGCLLTYTSVFLLGTDGGLVSERHFPAMCSAKSWVLSIGFTLSFGAVFSKTWRVHAIFTNIKLNKKVIKDYKLFMLVAFFLFVDCVTLSVWQIIDPARRETKELQPETDPQMEDRVIIRIIEFCTSDHMTIWLAVIYVYKGLLLIFGCFLAWETRHVSVPALNDSKYIGMSVYNVVIMCVAGVPISFIIKDRPDAAYLIIALFIIFCTTITLCLVFVPKLIELKRDPRGDEKRIRATLRKRTIRDVPGSEWHHKIRQISEDNYKCRQLLEQKKREIQELLVQLGEEALLCDGLSKSPGHKAVLALKGNHARSLPGRSPDGGSLNSDDDDSLLSSSSATNLWPLEASCRAYLTTRHQTSTDTRCTEQIELSDLGGSSVLPESPLVLRDRPLDANRDPLENIPPHFELPPPTYDEIMRAPPHRASRGGSESSSRTPSYQGLKYLSFSDIYTLKETAILSDSDPDDKSDSCSLHSLPEREQEHDEDVADVTTSLLS